MATGLPGTLWCVFRRDMLLAARKPADAATPLVFFAIVVSLFPLGVGPDPMVLRSLAPGVLWVAALLATLLSLNRLFSMRRSARCGSAIRLCCCRRHSNPCCNESMHSVPVIRRDD